MSDLLEFLHCMNRLKTISDTFEHFLLKFPKAVSDIAKGLFLHSNDIVYQDLKPGNVLVSNKHYLNKTITAELLFINVTLHRISGIKVNVRAQQNDMLDNRQ